jgi:hypothetical protein
MEGLLYKNQKNIKRVWRSKMAFHINTIKCLL